MNYPLISEYIESIKSAEDNFNELGYLRPVLGDDGLPVMTSGNFAVVLKMKDVKTGKFYALKCFTKEQEGRAEAYREITKELENVSSPYILSIRYLEKELFVDTDQTTETEFPVLLMDWVDGKPLDKYIRENIESKFIIETLLENFYQLSEWLISQPFAHGDLKPDNILVKSDGTLILVDYDGMYVSAMKGQKSREIGSPDFCHPHRSEDFFNEHIDDFSILSILLSLCIVFIDKNYLAKYGAEDRLLFSKNDYSNIHRSNIFIDIPPIIETSTNYKSLFEKACDNSGFNLEKGLLTPIIMLIAARRKEVNDAIKELAHLGGVLERYKVNQKYISTFPNRNTQQHAASNTTRQSDSKDQKDKESTEWRSALVIQILCLLFLMLVSFFHPENDIGGALLLRYIIFFCGICCAIYWLYVCISTYIKNGGNNS